VLLVGLCLIGWAGLNVAASASGSTPARTARATPHTNPAGTNGLKAVGVSSGGHARAYLLYVPPGDSSKHPLPLVLVYHGAGETDMNPPTDTGLLSADEKSHSMILAFLQGYDNTWNEGAGNTPAHQAGINDVAFTSLVLQRIETHYDVDMHRVVATGISNGALMTELLGCRLAGSLTLVVPVEGELPVSVASGCRPALPISIFEVHGTTDPDIPYGGGHFDGIGGGTTVLSAPASVARWAALDHCAGKTNRSQSGKVVLTGFKACSQGVTVTLDTIIDGQHVWPPAFAQTLAHAITALPTTRTASKP
jgi:polyhydroxybutyrate depolymerase